MQSIIFSVYQSNLSELDNVKNHNDIKYLLELMRIHYKELDGFFKDTQEKSLQVFTDIPYIIQICEEYNQESYLLLNNNYAKIIDTTTKEIIFEGVYTEINKSQIDKFDGYTYYPETNQYFTML